MKSKFWQFFIDILDLKIQKQHVSCLLDYPTGQKQVKIPSIFHFFYDAINTNFEVNFNLYFQITLDFNECSSHSWSSSLVELRTREQKWAKKETQFRHATLTQNASKTIHKFDKSKEIVVGANWNSRSWLGSHGY